MVRFSEIVAGIAMAVVAAIVAVPTATQTTRDDATGSQLCTTDQPAGFAPTIADDSFAAFLGDHSAHEGAEDRSADWRKPHLATFRPETAKVDFEIRPLSGTDIVAGEVVKTVVRISDARTGLPISGRSVAGWMVLRRNAQVSAETSCKAKAQLYAQGRVTAHADVDLNSYKLLILNRDQTVSVANPHVDFTITQLESMIPLPGVPGDWALSPDRATLFVSLPALGSVITIDTATLRVKGLLETGPGTIPTAMMALGSRRVAVALSARNSIAVLDERGGEPPVPITVGTGSIMLEHGPEGSLFAASGDGHFVKVEPRSAKTLLAAEAAGGITAFAYSSKAGLLFVASENADELVAYDAKSFEIRRRIAVEQGVFTLAVEPEGQFLLLLNRSKSTLSIVDALSGKMIGEARVAKSPVEIAFSSDYAYIRGQEGDHFSVVELAELRAGRIAAANVQSSAGPMTLNETLARAKLVAPSEHGALVANPAERVAYDYMEGMNAPMGAVKLYGPNVQGIMALDRGFRETAPGTYETTVIMPFGGVYDIPIAVDSADFVTCFDAIAKPPPDQERDRVAGLLVEMVVASDIAAGIPGNARVKISDPDTHKPAEGLKDVRLLAFSPSGSWQMRKWAHELGGGEYQVVWRLPRSGRYGFSVSVASRKLNFADHPPVFVKVREPNPILSKEDQP